MTALTTISNNKNDELSVFPAISGHYSIRFSAFRFLMNDQIERNDMDKSENPGVRSVELTGILQQLFRYFFVLITTLCIPLTSHASEIAHLFPACDGCHGQNGQSENSVVPIIAGQTFTLLEDNLLAYRDDEASCIGGELVSGEAAALLLAMCALVAVLSDEEIVALANYYEQKDFVPVQQWFDAALARQGGVLHKAQKCEQCHSGGGRESNEMAALLAGQWTPYLETALNRLRAGEKKAPVVMKQAIARMTDSDIQTLLHFYASEAN
jgi:sulfide dehydrogenase cytochrome subunit